MNRVLLGFIVRRHWLSTSLCGVAPILVGVMTGLIYPTYSRERELMRLFRTSTRFFGGGQMDLFSPEGAFTLPFQHPLSLVAYAVIAAVPAMALPAGERGRGALDLLLATPLERREVVTTVAAFQAVLAVWIGLAALAGAWIGAAISGVTGDVPWTRFAVLALNAAALCLVFGAIALTASVVGRDRAAATLAYGVAVFVALLIDVAARLWREGPWLGRLSPYGYLRPSEVVAGGGAVDILALVLAAALLFAAARRLEVRRREA